MTDRELQNILQKSYSEKASEGLRTKIKVISQNERPIYGYVFFMRPVLVFAVIALLVVPSGIFVASAARSTPGDPFFPVKKAVVQFEMSLTRDGSKKQLLEQELNVELAPTKTPTPTPKITSQFEANKNKITPEPTKTEHGKAVKGASTSSADSLKKNLNKSWNVEDQIFDLFHSSSKHQDHHKD